LIAATIWYDDSEVATETTLTLLVPLLATNSSPFPLSNAIPWGLMPVGDSPDAEKFPLTNVLFAIASVSATQNGVGEQESRLGRSIAPVCIPLASALRSCLAAEEETEEKGTTACE
jgi:hypothetical protein